MMKKKNGLALRRLGTEAFVVAESLALVDFDRLVTLNDSALYVWENLPASDFAPSTIARLLTARYDVTEATALTDAQALAGVWREAGIIEEQ